MNLGKKPAEESLAAIEENQKLLRDSIEQTKQLAAESERLIGIHRKEVKQGSSKPEA